MRFKTWAWGLSLASAALLSACGSGSDDNTTQISLLNASVGYSALGMEVDDVTINSSIAYANVGSYGTVDVAETGTEVISSGVGTTLASSTPSLATDSHYTLIAYGWAGSLKTTLLQEDQDAADSGKASLLVLNLAPDAGALDVYVTASEDSLTDSTALASAISGGSGSGYNTINAGTYRIRVTGYNSKTDVRLDIPSVTLSSTSVSTLVLTATSGGVLVNGMHMIQQGTVTNYANTTSRVRMVAANNNSAVVTGSLGQTSLLSSSTAPSIGEYKTVTPGADTLGIYVNGTAMSLSQPTFKAGADYTLLVWGDSGTPQLSVLADDNRLPTSASTAKLRLINGVAGTSSGLTLNMDYSAVASNVTPGTSSTPTTVSSSTSSLLTVTSALSSTPVFSIEDLTIQSYGVYTVFVMGDSSKMVGSLRKER